MDINGTFCVGISMRVGEVKSREGATLNLPNASLHADNNIWNIALDKSIWKAKTFAYERLADREANKCRNLIIDGAQKGWTSLGYVVTEDGKYVPRFEDIAARVLKIKLSVDEL